MIGALLYALGGFIEMLIGLRIVLRLLGANPAAALVNWVYSWSEPFVAPFAGIFHQPTATSVPGFFSGSIFDWTALIALLVIGLIVGLVGRVFSHHNRPVYY